MLRLLTERLLNRLRCFVMVKNRLNDTGNPLAPRPSVSGRRERRTRPCEMELRCPFGRLRPPRTANPHTKSVQTI
jgi:hypothetical protein